MSVTSALHQTILALETMPPEQIPLRYRWLLEDVRKGAHNLHLLELPDVMSAVCHVACHNSNGEPEVATCTILCTEEEFENGVHYAVARDAARDDGYSVLITDAVFDITDPGFTAFKETADMLPWQWVVSPACREKIRS